MRVQRYLFLWNRYILSIATLLHVLLVFILSDNTKTIKKNLLRKIVRHLSNIIIKNYEKRMWKYNLLENKALGHFGWNSWYFKGYTVINNQNRWFYLFLFFFFVESPVWKKTKTSVQTKSYKRKRYKSSFSLQNLSGHFSVIRTEKAWLQEDRRVCCSQLA